MATMPAKIFGISKKYLLPFIIIVAFILRLPNKSGTSLYWYSELFRDLSAEKLLAGGTWVFYGPPSHLGGFNFGPIYYYLLFPFARAFHFTLYSTAIASLFFSLAAILMSFFVVRKWHSEQLAYIVAALLSICEFDISFARYASNPNFLPFFSLVFFYAFQQIMERKNTARNTFLLSISFAVATQLHAVALISLPVILAVALIRRDICFSFKQWAIFITGNLILYAPYLYFELTHRFVDLTGLLHLAGTSASEGLGQRLVEYFGFWLGPWVIAQPDFDVLYIIGRPMIYAIAAILVVGYFVFKYNQNRLQPRSLGSGKISRSVKTTLLYWLIFPTALLLTPIGPVTTLLIFYFFLLTPLLYFLYGWIFFKLFQRGWNLTGWYLLTVFVCLQIFQFLLYSQQLRQIRF